MLVIFAYLIQSALFLVDLRAGPVQILALAAIGAHLVTFGSRFRHPCAAVTLVFTAITLAVSLFVASSFFDKSWDGLWYHQAAALEISSGWNPSLSSSAGGQEHSIWIDHYPRFTWIIGELFYSVTGSLEAMKAIPLLLAISALALTHSALRSTGVSRLAAAGYSALAVLNPIVTNQMFTGYVDGVLYLLLLIMAAAFLIFRRSPVHAGFILAGAIVAAVNTKFTGGPYSIIVFGAGIYLLSKFEMNRESKLAALNCALAFATGAVVFGWSPYVQNVLNHGHPFYPLMGQGAVDIISFTLPKGFEDGSYLSKLGKSLWGHVADGEFKGYLIPIVGLTLQDVRASIAADGRISGFGFLFGGIVILSTLILFAMLRTMTSQEAFLLIIVLLSIAAAVAINPQAWWARYVPQLWVAPLIISYYLVNSSRRYLVSVGSLLLLMIAANSLIIAAGSAGSNYLNSQRVKAQMDAMRGETELVYLYTDVFVTIEQRLVAHGVRVVRVSTVDQLPCNQPLIIEGSFGRAKYCQ